MLIKFTEFEAVLPAHDEVVWVNPWGVNSVRPSHSGLTRLVMDNGDFIVVREPVEEVVEAINARLR